MPRFVRIADGARLDAEQYDGTADSVRRIRRLIGPYGVAQVKAGLFIDRPHEGLSGHALPGTWVVKTPQGVRLIADGAMGCGYRGV